MKYLSQNKVEIVMTMVTRIIGSLAIIAVFAAGVADVQAEGNHWDPNTEWDAGAGDWLTDTNWDPSGLPGTESNVNIAKDGANVTLDLGDLPGDLNIVDLWLAPISADSVEMTVKRTEGDANLNFTGGRGSWSDSSGTHPTSLFIGGRHRDADPSPTGTATFNLEGGDITATERVYVGVFGGTGTLNVSGGSLTVNRVDIGRGPDSTGTFRAIIGRNGYQGSVVVNDLQLSQKVSGNDPEGTEGDANLRVALDGGVMLSGESGYTLIESGSIDGSWHSEPSELWTRNHDNNNVNIELNTDVKRG